MNGPFPRGHFSERVELRDFRRLVRGERYRVVHPFCDFDGDEHVPGESWLFLGHHFVPYDDGLSLFVSLDGVGEWQIRMRWTDEDQGPIVDALERFVAPSPATTR